MPGVLAKWNLACQVGKLKPTQAEIREKACSLFTYKDSVTQELTTYLTVSNNF